MTPAEMLNIFRNKIVVMRGVPSTDSCGGLDYLKITPKSGASGEARLGELRTDVPVVQVERANAGDPGAFLTWIVDYAHNDIRYTTISPARPFCFTATMNGCTFGIGSPGPNGVLTVSHANATAVGNAGGLGQQIERQNRMGVRSDGARNFDPTNYEVGIYADTMGLNTTLVGIYDDGAWSFYYQTYACSGTQYVVRTFRKVDVNRLRA